MSQILKIFITQPYTRALRGEKIYTPILGKRYRHENFIAGLLGNKVITPSCQISILLISYELV